MMLVVTFVVVLLLFTLIRHFFSHKSEKRLPSDDPFPVGLSFPFVYVFQLSEVVKLLGRPRPPMFVEGRHFFGGG